MRTTICLELFEFMSVRASVCEFYLSFGIYVNWKSKVFLMALVCLFANLAYDYRNEIDRNLAIRIPYIYRFLAYVYNVHVYKSQNFRLRDTILIA